MTTLAHTGTFVALAAPAQTGKRTMLLSLVTMAMVIALIFGFAYSQGDGTMTMLRSLLPDDRLGFADIELRILGAVFAPSILGLVLIFLSLGLPDDSTH